MEESQRAFVSKTSVSFTADNPNPSIALSGFNKYVFSVKLGDLDDMAFEDSANMTLDAWCIEVIGMNYAGFLSESGYVPFYKNKELTQPFSGTDMVNAGTVIYTEYSIGGGRGEKIGEITGTITLTDISNPPPKVYIRAASWYTSFSTSRSEIKGITGTSGTFNWSIPVYENDRFEPGEIYFQLWVRTGASRDDGFSIDIPTTIDIDTLDAAVGSLGTVSIASITLSGTITVTNNGNPVPRVEIEVVSESTWDQLGGTSLTSPGSNAAWSITIPVLDTPDEIYFRIRGYTSNGDPTLDENYYPETPIEVWNENKSGIVLSLAYKSITLSGTINATYGGDRVSRVEISVQGYDEQKDDWIYGYTSVNSSSANAPWSITIPLLDSPTDVSFSVTGYTSNWDYLFTKENIATETVSNQNVSGISLTVAIQTVTLSGTINVTYDGSPVPEVEIGVYGYDFDSGDSISGRTSLYLPGANVPWSIKVPAPDSPIEVDVIYIYFYSGNGDYLSTQYFYPETPITVSKQAVSGIEIDLGDIQSQ
jgi:hypothetical protein